MQLGWLSSSGPPTPPDLNPVEGRLGNMKNGQHNLMGPQR